MTGVLTNYDRVLQAAAELLEEGGVDAVSTRAVAAGAGLQAPAIYREFGDKDGLLDALTTFVLQKYVHKKRRILKESSDPVTDLRRLWDMHVEFGFRHSDSYVLIYGRAHKGRMSPGASETLSLLGEAIARIGDAGLLRMSVERATSLMYAAGVGLVMTQIAVPARERDAQIVQVARENAIEAILATPKRRTAAHAADVPGRAVALRQALMRQDEVPLSHAEASLLEEWLNRLADHR
jgi:AcrR family transcriptional regulator